MNLLMTAPLCDSRGKIRYHIGAQVDVSGLVKDCTDLDSLRTLIMNGQHNQSAVHNHNPADRQDKEDEFQALSEMLNLAELDTVRKWGGRMHREFQDTEMDGSGKVAAHMPRLLLKEPNIEANPTCPTSTRGSGRLSGIYQNVSTCSLTFESEISANFLLQYLLIRPYPSLRILFASPTLRVPGILQAHFMTKIGGSSRVRDELTSALAEGRGVTAKVRWISKADEDGRNRWIHCTPLLGSNSHIGVWMVVLIDDEQELSRRWKQAPPVGPHRGKVYGSFRDAQDSAGMPEGHAHGDSRNGSMRDHPIKNYNRPRSRAGAREGSFRSSSPNSVRIF